MRENKFRAWDKKLKQYVDPNHILIDGQGDLFSWADNKLDSDRFIVEFYTGMDDHLKEEIYKGDIVQTDFGGGFVGEVKYQGGEWVLRDHSGAQRLAPLYQNNWELKIIGNIYENPERLT